MKALLESGVHFGHRTNKWDPRMKPYIFTERNGIHIIDLQQTVKLLTPRLTVIRDAVAGGGTVLFVGTKRQAQETIRDEAAARRHAVRYGTLAGRNAHELVHHARPNPGARPTGGFARHRGDQPTHQERRACLSSARSIACSSGFPACAR